jgi:hypothetical protein
MRPASPRLLSCQRYRASWTARRAATRTMARALVSEAPARVEADPNRIIMALGRVRGVSVALIPRPPRRLRPPPFHRPRRSPGQRRAETLGSPRARATATGSSRRARRMLLRPLQPRLARPRRPPRVKLGLRKNAPKTRPQRARTASILALTTSAGTNLSKTSAVLRPLFTSPTTIR